MMNIRPTSDLRYYEYVENALDEADKVAEENTKYITEDKMVSKIRRNSAE